MRVIQQDHNSSRLEVLERWIRYQVRYQLAFFLQRQVSTRQKTKQK